MRLLAALLAGSGVAWMVVMVVTNPFLLDPPALPLMVVAPCFVLIASGTMLAVRQTSQLPGRLLGLWVLAVVASVAVMTPHGLDLYVLAFASIYGTVAFLLWAAPPLVVFSFIRQLRPTKAHPVAPAFRETRDEQLH